MGQHYKNNAWSLLSINQFPKLFLTTVGIINSAYLNPMRFFNNNAQLDCGLLEGLQKSVSEVEMSLFIDDGPSLIAEAIGSSLDWQGLK